MTNLVESPDENGDVVVGHSVQDTCWRVIPAEVFDLRVTKLLFHLCVMTVSLCSLYTRPVVLLAAVVVVNIQ